MYYIQLNEVPMSEEKIVQIPVILMGGMPPILNCLSLSTLPPLPLLTVTGALCCLSLSTLPLSPLLLQGGIASQVFSLLRQNFAFASILPPTLFAPQLEEK